jgi:hypothetical protein
VDDEKEIFGQLFSAITVTGGGGWGRCVRLLQGSIRSIRYC